MADNQAKIVARLRGRGWEFREIPGIRGKIPGIFGTIPRNRGTAGWIFPTVPVRRLTIPRRRQKNPRKEVTVPRNYPAAVGKRGTVVGDFLVRLRSFPVRCHWRRAEPFAPALSTHPMKREGEETKETVRRPAAFVPAGTLRFPGHQPSTEVPGYFRSSLRDCAHAHGSRRETAP